MSTIVYQEIQPCSESYFIESRTLSLKLSSPKNTISQTCSNNTLSSKFEYGSKTTSSSKSSSCSWSEIEALTTKRNTMEKGEQVYVHPLVKKSSFKLSQKSLEMCTESLGSETGCCSMESSDLFSLMTMEARRKPQEKLEKRKELFKDHGNFPPPITTLRGSDPVHVKTIREDGRLIIEAVRTPSPPSYMQAERKDGRLKLSFVRDCYTDNDDCCSSDEEDDNCDCECQTMEDEEALERYVEEDVENEDKLNECNRSDEYILEEMKGITIEFGVTLGLGKLQRPSRCKEGGPRSKRLINWEPFWVAT